MKVSFSGDIILCGRLGLKHQLEITNRQHTGTFISASAYPTTGCVDEKQTGKLGHSTREDRRAKQELTETVRYRLAVSQIAVTMTTRRTRLPPKASKCFISPNAVSFNRRERERERGREREKSSSLISVNSTFGYLSLIITTLSSAVTFNSGSSMEAKRPILQCPVPLPRGDFSVIFGNGKRAVMWRRRACMEKTKQLPRDFTPLTSVWKGRYSNKF